MLTLERPGEYDALTRKRRLMLQVRKEAANALTGIGEAAAPEIVVEDLAAESRPDEQRPMLQILSNHFGSNFFTKASRSQLELFLASTRGGADQVPNAP